MTRITEDTQEMVERLCCLAREEPGKLNNPELALMAATIERQASQLAGVVGERDALRAAAEHLLYVGQFVREDETESAVRKLRAALSPNQGAKL